jgi:stage II sporulation protein AA (anti-sigma F factor antagonist)
MPLEIAIAREQEIAIVAPAGAVDTRSSSDLEKALLGLAGEGVTRIVVDLAGVSLLTSAGIRVLVMLGKRVRLSEGGLVLCGMNEHVHSVFEVSGLLPLFTIVPQRADAVSSLAPRKGAGGSSSKLARTTLRLLGFGAAHLPPAQAGPPLPPGTTRQIASLLVQADTRRSSSS